MHRCTCDRSYIYMCELFSVHVLLVVNPSYPVKNGQVHPHVESASGEFGCALGHT